jgi:hypothetical protein
MPDDVYVKANAAANINNGAASSLISSTSNTSLAQVLTETDILSGKLTTRFDDASYYASQLPKRFAGLTLWLRADYGAYFSGIVAEDGDAITSWRDSSNANNHCTQSTQSKSPTLEEAVKNGKPVMRFDGVDDHMTHTASLPQQAQTAIAVLKRASGGLADFQTLVRLRSIPIFARLQTSENWGTHMGIELVSSFNLTNVWKVVTTVIRAYNDVSLWTNETIETFTTGTSFTNSNDRSIGAIPGAGEDQYFKGDLAELAVYNRALSNVEVLTLVRYFNTKYAIY